MAGSIPQDIIDQVRQASDIVEIIGEYVRLKKRGRNYMALCPFHTEKTASFSVSPERQIYHCFGCGKGGNVYTFLMEHENMSFVEAVRHLARKAGIIIPEREADRYEKEEIEKLHYAHQVALEYFRSILSSGKYHAQISKYLKESRRLTDESIELFQLGLAGDDWDGFLNHALKKGLFPKELEKAGLIVHSEKRDKYFDRFRQRLMIPIFNLTGKPIAFGGRTLRKGEPAKYVNSPETPLYSKSNVLYGLNFSRQFIREKKEVIIVEGYFDLISLYQAGIRNVVASSGTAFTIRQARLLARFAEMGFLFFDADSAGEKAAIRSVDALYDAGMEVMVMVPPEGEDPDSVAIEGGPAAVEKIKTDALRYLDFRTRDIDIQKQGIIGKEKLIKELAELAGRIEDTTRRRLFIDEAADVIKTDRQNFYDLLPSGSTERAAGVDIKPPRKIVDFERDLVSLLINYPEHIETVKDKVAPGDFQSEMISSIYSQILSSHQTHGSVSVDRLIDLLDDKSLASEVTTLSQKEWPRESAPRMIPDYVNKILYFKRERQIDRLKAELKVAEEAKDAGKADRLTLEIAELIKRRGE
jgi:DNA primase